MGLYSKFCKICGQKFFEVRPRSLICEDCREARYKLGESYKNELLQLQEHLRRAVESFGEVKFEINRRWLEKVVEIIDEGH